MKRGHKERLSQADLKAAGVTPQLVTRRIRHSPGPNEPEPDGQEGGVLPYNTEQRDPTPDNPGGDRTAGKPTRGEREACKA